MFPPFVANIIDPLHFFSDNSFHLECLNHVKNGKRTIKYADIRNLKTRPENRKCIVTQELITNESEHIFIPYLTSDKSSNLHKFNFTHINILNLSRWKDREHVTKELIKFHDSGTWGETNDKYLIKLIDILGKGEI